MNQINIYLENIGFKGYTDKQVLEEVINPIIDKVNLALKHNDKEKILEELSKIKNTKLEYNIHSFVAQIKYKISKSVVIYIYGKIREKKFVFESFAPFIVTHKDKNDGRLKIKKSTQNNEYYGFYEDAKNDYELFIFRINDLISLLNKQDAKQNKKILDKYDIAISENVFEPEETKNVSFSAIAASAKIILPITTIEDKIFYETNKDRIELEKNIFKDIFSFIETAIVLVGPESNNYTITANIISYTLEKNRITKQEVYIIEAVFNNVMINIAINKEDLEGKIEVGRRIRANGILLGDI